jgi:DNA polymerase elongation subunit (family B)
MLVFDIETLPTKDPEVIKRIAATIRPPGNIKKADSIKTWMDENYGAALKEAVAKTALDGAYGRVACIAWQIGYDLYNTTKELNEREVIDTFYNSIIYQDDLFCGHNIANFDLPFLMHRSMILGIKPPASILKAMKAKPWDDCIKDTMIMWTSSPNKYIKLDVLLWLFGIDHGHPEFDGSMVAETWETDPQKVIDYCCGDVRSTYELYQKMTFGEKVF